MSLSTSLDSQKFESEKKPYEERTKKYYLNAQFPSRISLVTSDDHLPICPPK